MRVLNTKAIRRAEAELATREVGLQNKMPTTMLEIKEILETEKKEGRGRKYSSFSGSSATLTMDPIKDNIVSISLFS